MTRWVYDNPVLGVTLTVKILVKKILEGGSGIWGEIPMPPHSQYNEEQASQMVDAILSLGESGHKE